MRLIQHLLAGAAVGLLAGATAAAPVDYLAGASAQTDDGFVVSFAQQFSAAQSSAYTSPTTTEIAHSSASLAGGSLHLSTTNIANGSNQGQVAVATAFVGDSFTHTAGLDPFTWTSATQATFNIQLDGATALNPGPGEVFNLGYVALIIYQPGTLSDVVPFCDSTVTQAFFWSVGPQARATNPCGGSFLGNIEGTVDQLLSVTFTPGGDFDFAFGMRVGGAFNANLSAPAFGTWFNDFANTATLSYQAPVGATVISSSGVFPGTTAAQVPEPGTLALVGAAAFGFVGWRRPARRGQQGAIA